LTGVDASTKFGHETRRIDTNDAFRATRDWRFSHYPRQYEAHLPMDYEIRPLLANDEPILREMLYQGLSSIGNHQPSREILQRPEFSHYAEGWGRAGDTGFVAHDKKDGSVIGAVWLRKPIDNPDAPPELAFAVKPEHRRHGIGTALLTQLVRANPHESIISVSLVAGKPVLRLYERFGFKVAEEGSNAIVMRRHV